MLIMIKNDPSKSSLVLENTHLIGDPEAPEGADVISFVKELKILMNKYNMKEIKCCKCETNIASEI
jgi:hypothetical protein